MKKILIVGLHHDQEHHVISRYRNKKHKIKFFHTDGNMKTLFNIKNDYDYVFLMKKFTAHRLTDCVNIHNHDGFVFILGGLSTLYKKIDERVSNECLRE